MEKIELPAADDCPVAPPPRVTVYTRVLHRACQKLGGVEAVGLVMPPWSPEDDAHAKATSSSRPKKN